MEQTIRIAGLVKESIVDGPGFRYTLFTQGCPHHCPGCHNPETHDFAGGRLITVDEVTEDFFKNPMLKGITLSGGEPFAQAQVLASLAERIRAKGKDVVVYTGYTFEQLLSGMVPHAQELLAQTDLLIDGRFELEQRDLTLKFRGSANQRILDCPRSLLEGRAVHKSL